MKAPLRSIAIAALFGVVLTPLDQVAAVPSEPSFGATLTAGSYVPGEVLVKFKPAYSAQHRMSAVAIQGHAVLADLNQPGWVQVKIGAGQSMTQVLASYQNNLDVEYAQPNYIYRATAVPNDTRYGELWAFKNLVVPGADINIEKAWDHRTDCSSVVVAVIDSGINYNQEDLVDSMWNGLLLHGWDFVANDNDPMDLHGHGTHVAGIVGATGNNATGVTGVCWTARIMAVRVLNAMGGGTTASIIQGINLAVSNGAKVINMSLGGSNPFDQAFSSAITNAQNNDVVVVVAAGNEANNNDGGSTRYPCNFTQPNLVCVAALDQNFALADLSNWGATSVDVGAPGTNIVSAWAGTNASISDPLTSEWTFATTTTGGWAFGAITLDGMLTQILRDPSNYPTGQYRNSTDDRAYKAFNLAGVNVALLQFLAAANIVNGDRFRLGFRGTGGDPFAGGTIVGELTGVATFPFFFASEFDISGCISSNCSVGFQLQTDSAQTDIGVAVALLSIQTLTLNNVSYSTRAGTSMATPMVTGLAAMLRAYNPQYTYADVVSAIKNGGRPVAALTGKTTTGRAIDIMSSLSYINPPTGLRATVQDAEQ